MSTDTEKAFEGWETEGFSGDETHHHFEQFGQWSWIDNYWEGCRLLGVLIKEEVDTESVFGQVIAGVAAQSAHGAYASVAAMLGLDARTLELAASEWYEKQDDLPPPLTLEQFRDKYKETEEWMANLKAGNNAS